LRVANTFIVGKAIFKEALADGSMECYFPLAEQFITQAEPETCGPTSLVMVLNSLNVDPGKQWKGIWRWYT
jgi:glutathione gamma-glutamylcysteinyltransferase